MPSWPLLVRTQPYQRGFRQHFCAHTRWRISRAWRSGPGRTAPFRYQRRLIGGPAPDKGDAARELEAAVYAIEELEETARLALLLRGANPRLLTPSRIRDVVDHFSVEWD